MPTLTQILDNTLKDNSVASSFVKNYNKSLNEVLIKYGGLIYRPHFSATESLDSRKRQFNQVRKKDDNLVIIPYDENPALSLVCYEKSNHMMKKYFLLSLFKDKTIKDAIKYKSLPSKKFFFSLSLAKLEDRFVGYDFGTPPKVVYFTDAIMGAGICEKFDVSMNRDYNDNDYALSNGGLINADVKSQSENVSYKLSISNVPILHSDKKAPDIIYSLWQKMEFKKHDCGKFFWGDHSFYRPIKILKADNKTSNVIRRESKIENIACKHMIAALKAYNKVRSKTKIAVDPFVEFSEKGINYYNLLCNRTLMEIRDEKGVVHLEPLNEVNINLLLWDYVKLNPWEVGFRI